MLAVLYFLAVFAALAVMAVLAVFSGHILEITTTMYHNKLHGLGHYSSYTL